jgi:hypothetical protein
MADLRRGIRLVGHANARRIQGAVGAAVENQESTQPKEVGLGALAILITAGHV